MMEIALTLLACAVFAALTAIAITAALKSARVDDIIGEVFSPWKPDSLAATAARRPADAARVEAETPTPHGARAGPRDPKAVSARV
jgi:hypothetical protein